MRIEIVGLHCCNVALPVDMVPRYPPSEIEVENTRVVGHGGNRGATVLATRNPVRAVKVYEQHVISSNEYDFMAAVWEWIRRQPAYDGDDRGAAITDLAFRVHTVVPLGLTVTERNSDHGIIMPLLSRSLYSFLRHTQKPQSEYNVEPHSVFRCIKSFEPIQAPQVVAAILFQTVLGLTFLHTELPHMGPDNQPKKGFSHNDLHLSNLLLHYDSGTVLLCDFELVHHDPPVANARTPSRAPPKGRVSPHGYFSPHSDTWGVGLLAVDMMTGVVGLIDGDAAFDDFGDGPLLLSPDCYDGDVVDWDSNMCSFVESLLGAVHEDDAPAKRLLMGFCRRCLSNTADEVPPSIKELLEDPLFQLFSSPLTCGLLSGDVFYSDPAEAPRLRAQEVVRRFLLEHELTRPKDRSAIGEGSDSAYLAPLSNSLGSTNSIASLSLEG